MAHAGRVHDRAVLDALDVMKPVRFNSTVWRITRAGRDATRGSAATGRWSPGGTVAVLCASLEQDWALAEIGYRLALEPVSPSRMQHEMHELTVQTAHSLVFADTASLAPLGVDVVRYESFDCFATQALAAAALFLEFDGLLVPSARHTSTNLVLFVERGLPGSLDVKSTQIVDWGAWRRQRDSRSFGQRCILPGDEGLNETLLTSARRFCGPEKPLRNPPCPGAGTRRIAQGLIRPTPSRHIGKRPLSEMGIGVDSGMFDRATTAEIYAC